MAENRFVPGTRYELDGDRFVVIETLPDAQILVNADPPDQPRPVRLDDLMEALERGDLRILPKYGAANDHRPSILCEVDHTYYDVELDAAKLQTFISRLTVRMGIDVYSRIVTDAGAEYSPPTGEVVNDTEARWADLIQRAPPNPRVKSRIERIYKRRPNVAQDHEPEN